MAKEVSRIKFTKPVDFGNQTITNLTLPDGVTLPESATTNLSKATNIENGTGTNAIQQKPENFNLDDGTAITAGATNEYAVSLTGKSAAYGKRALAHGTRVRATGDYSHAEGNNTLSEGKNSHAEGMQTAAKGTSSHAEGYQTVANAETAHTEGFKGSTTGYGSHIEGGASIISSTLPSGGGEGGSSSGTPTSESPDTHLGTYSHAEGDSTYVHGYAAHAEGILTKAYGHESHTEGYKTKAGAPNDLTKGTAAHAEGKETVALGNASHAEGVGTQAIGDGSHASGYGTVATNTGETVIGFYNDVDTTGKALFTVGNGVSEGGTSNAFVVYNDSTAILGSSQVATESYVTSAITTKLADYSKLKYLVNGSAQGSLQVEAGKKCTASNQYATALGYSNTASGYGSFAIGGGTTASSYWAFAGGEGSQATASHAFAYGLVAKAGHAEQFAIGKYNENKDNTLFEIGKGTAATPSNAFEVYQDGHATVGAMGTTDLSVATKKYVDDNSVVGTCVSKAGDTMTGALAFGTATNKIQSTSDGLEIESTDHSIKISSSGHLTLDSGCNAYITAGDDVVITSEDDSIIITSGATENTTIDGTVIPKNAELMTGCNVEEAGEYILKCSVVQDGYTEEAASVWAVAEINVQKPWTYQSGGTYEAILRVQTPGLKELNFITDSNIGISANIKSPYIITIDSDNNLGNMLNYFSGQIILNGDKTEATIFLWGSGLQASEYPELTGLSLTYLPYKPNWVRTYSWVKLDIE